jgi:signal peptidase I
MGVSGELTMRELAAFGLGGLVALAAANLGPVHARMVPSGSMAPTFLPGDRMLVITRSPSRAVARGEILVFKPPFASFPGDEPAFGWLAGETTYVKRAIGLPGDRVEVKKGVGVVVNGTLLAEPYVLQAPSYGWGPAVVPPGRLFMLGDNRNDSFDSHYWGFLPQDHVVGRPGAVIWPPSRWRGF